MFKSLNSSAWTLFTKVPVTLILLFCSYGHYNRRPVVSEQGISSFQGQYIHETIQTNNKRKLQCLHLDSKPRLQCFQTEKTVYALDRTANYSSTGIVTPTQLHLCKGNDIVNPWNSKPIEMFTLVCDFLATESRKQQTSLRPFCQYHNKRVTVRKIICYSY
jgi:hypothetical protein